MNEYRHHLSGFFANRDDARSAFSTLLERGLPRERLQIFETDSPTPAPVPKADSNAVLKDVVVDGDRTGSHPGVSRRLQGHPHGLNVIDLSVRRRTQHGEPNLICLSDWRGPYRTKSRDQWPEL